MSSAKWRLFRLDLNVLNPWINSFPSDVNSLVIIVSENSLAPDKCQATIWIMAVLLSTLNMLNCFLRLQKIYSHILDLALFK